MNTNCENHNCIEYTVENIENFVDNKVLIMSGGDSALDNALFLNSVAKEVIPIHRRSKFSALESTIHKVEKSNIHTFQACVFKEILDHENKTVILKKMKNRKELKVSVDKIIANYGLRQNTKFLNDWELDLKNSKVVTFDCMQTSKSRIFAAGDNGHYSAKTYRLTTGFGESHVAIEGIISNFAYTIMEVFHHDKYYIKNL